MNFIYLAYTTHKSLVKFITWKNLYKQYVIKLNTIFVLRGIKTVVRGKCYEPSTAYMTAFLNG